MKGARSRGNRRENDRREIRTRNDHSTQQERGWVEGSDTCRFKASSSAEKRKPHVHDKFTYQSFEGLWFLQFFSGARDILLNRFATGFTAAMP